VRKPYLWRGAKLLVAALASAMALTVMTAPASAAPSAADQVKISFERLPVAPAEAQVGVQQAAMVIQVANGTNFTFDELALFFTRFSNPLSEQQSDFNVAPGEAAVFTLDDCGDIDQYAIGVFVDGELLLNTGNIIPDRELCFENIGIV
jgi:hypothetical protein